MRRLVILLIFSFKCSWHIVAILRSSRPENSQNLCEKNCAGVPFSTKFQAADRLTRDSNTVFFKNTSGRLLWKKNFFFSHIFWVLYSHLKKVSFRIIGLFFLFMSGFCTFEPRHIDKASNKNKQRFY